MHAARTRNKLALAALEQNAVLRGTQRNKVPLQLALGLDRSRVLQVFVRDRRRSVKLEQDAHLVRRAVKLVSVPPELSLQIRRPLHATNIGDTRGKCKKESLARRKGVEPSFAARRSAAGRTNHIRLPIQAPPLVPQLAVILLKVFAARFDLRRQIARRRLLRRPVTRRQDVRHQLDTAKGAATISFAAVPLVVVQYLL